MNEKMNNASHELKMIDRSILSLTGVEKIVSFDNTEFILESNMGPIHLKGENLELLTLDTQDGVIRIKGKVSGFNYIEKIAKKKEESIIAKLFK
ncbi:MAG: sporulation protein YabP [Firmicutes bacterium]|nr:sporulation protein YabP [Bacillota bacterium]